MCHPVEASSYCSLHTELVEAEADDDTFAEIDDDDDDRTEVEPPEAGSFHH